MDDLGVPLFQETFKCANSLGIYTGCPELQKMIGKAAVPPSSQDFRVTLPKKNSTYCSLYYEVTGLFMLALSTAMLLQEESPAALHTIGPHHCHPNFEENHGKLQSIHWWILIFVHEVWVNHDLPHFYSILEIRLTLFVSMPQKKGAKSPLPRSNCPPGWSTAWTWHALHIDHAIRQHLGIRCIDLNQGCDFWGKSYRNPGSRHHQMGGLSCHSFPWNSAEQMTELCHESWWFLHFLLSWFKLLML